jgi:hypothetical protein
MNAQRSRSQLSMTEYVGRAARYRISPAAQWVILVTGFLALVATIRAASPAHPTSAQGSSQWTEMLPDGNGKSIVIAKCQDCHTLERVVHYHGTRNDWQASIQKMLGLGARLTNDEIPVVLDYLASNFKPEAVTDAVRNSSSSGEPPNPVITDLVVDPDRAQFVPVPRAMGLPNNLKMSIISGSPSETGTLSMLLKLPPSLTVAPHSNSADETVVPLRGMVEFGEGKTFNLENLQMLSPGMVMRIPARMRHFYRTTDSATLLVYGQGPWAMSYCNPADDPRNGTAAK